ASDADDDPAVVHKKRILRYGRERLSSMRQRFEDAKARLYDEKLAQLDLECAQLKDGSHPQYQVLLERVDARWAQRLEAIDFKLASRHSVAAANLAASRRAAADTF
ncbi:Transcriptional regulatory protein, partial [Coemansia helicoidea]